jgi:hypothetical protein
MYAQVVEGGTTPDRREQLDRLLLDELLPALREEPGFSGALSLVDPVTGNGMVLVFWETEEQACRAPSQCGRRCRQALAAIARLSTAGLPPISIWEVNARV